MTKNDIEEIKADAEFYDSTAAERLLSGHCLTLIDELAIVKTENEQLVKAVKRMWLHGERLIRSEYLRLTKTVDPLTSKPDNEATLDFDSGMWESSL